jgi:hypothetical protein
MVVPELARAFVIGGEVVAATTMALGGRCFSFYRFKNSKGRTLKTAKPPLMRPQGKHQVQYHPKTWN